MPKDITKLYFLTERNGMIYIDQLDCVESLQRHASGSVDCVFVDPPYNTGNKTDKAVKYDRNKDFEKKKWVSFHADWDSIGGYQGWSKIWLKEAQRILKPKGTIFVCGSHHCIPDIAIAMRQLEMYTIQWIQWCSPNAFPQLSMTRMVSANQTVIWGRAGKKDTHFYDAEAAKRYNDGKNLRDYWIIPQDTTQGRDWKHPSKKPPRLMHRALDIAIPKVNGAVIVDCFGGSGSTGIAALDVMTVYGLEWEIYLSDREEGYVDMMRKRVADWEGKRGLSL